MTSTKTLRKIVKALLNGDTYNARINGYGYTISMNNDRVRAKPYNNGDIAYSGMDWSDYKLTHAGETFRLAALLCDEVWRSVRKFKKNEQKYVETWTFEDTAGNIETHEVQITEFANGIPAHVCPLCGQLKLRYRGCDTGHITITPIIDTE